MDGAKKGIDESSAALHRHSEAGREVHRVMHLIEEQAPTLAIALRAATSVVGATMIGGIELFNREKEALKGLEESLTTSEWERYTAVIEARTKAMEALNEAEREHLRNIERIENRPSTATERSDAKKQIDKTKAEADAAINDANQRAELAATETIRDPIDKAQKKLEIEERYAAIKKQHDDDQAKRDVDEEHRKLANGQIEEARLGKALEAARGKQKSVPSEEEANKKLEIEKGRLAAIDAEIDKKTERHDALERIPWMERFTPQQMEMNELGLQLDALGKQRDMQKKLVSRIDARHPEEIDKARAASEAVKDLEQQHAQAADRVRSLRDNIPTDDAVSGIKTRERQQQYGIDQQTRLAQFNREVLSSPDGQKLRAAADAENLLQHGQKLTKAQDANLKAVENTLKSQGLSAEAVLKALGQSHSNDQALAKQIWAIHKEMEHLGAQIRAGHNP
jgi:hypothetical protein